MNTATQNSGSPSKPVVMSPEIRNAAGCLLQGWDYAQDANVDPSLFAVTIAELKATGLSLNDARWMSIKGYVTALRVPRKAARVRGKFTRISAKDLSDEACVCLTAKGAELLRQCAILAAEPRARVIPHWDPKRRELWYDGKLVKRYTGPAGRQERILAAFEEEGWPEMIDDPLPFERDTDPAARLHAAVRRLNRRQKHRALRFHCAGSGTIVRWVVAPVNALAE